MRLTVSTVAPLRPGATLRVLHVVSPLRVRRPSIRGAERAHRRTPRRGSLTMILIRQPDGTYSAPRSRAPITEADILAAAEDILRRRLERQGTLRTPRDAAEFLRVRLGTLKHEEFHVVWLDQRHRILSIERLFTGTLDGTAVHPREVVRRALDVNAAAAILAHNHPSAVCEPSSADLLITQELTAAFKLIGVRVIDHLVVGAGAAVSFAERGAL